MTVPQGDLGRPRATAARVGVTALNLLSPGSGLIRLGFWRAGLAWIFANQAVLILLALLANHTPVPSFRVLIGVAALFLLAELAILICPIVATWKRSAMATRPAWWGRWYSLIALIFIPGLLINPMQWIWQAYKPYYVASVSMLPTMEKNERIVADMRWRTAQVGNIVLVREPDGTTRIYRVAAVEGQTFAMKNGVPIIDGQSASQVPAGQITVADRGIGPQRGKILREHLPGEQGSHLIVDLGPNPQDEFPAIHIPARSVFLLGDDRDMAADSRIPRDMFGVGIMPITAITGRPLYFLWHSNRIGQRADH